MITQQYAVLYLFCSSYGRLILLFPAPVLRYEQTRFSGGLALHPEVCFDWSWVGHQKSFNHHEIAYCDLSRLFAACSLMCLGHPP